MPFAAMRMRKTAPAAAGFASAVLARSPWGFWLLNETGTLTTATDSSGNARHGTYAGTGTTGGATAPFGATSTAITLDGNGRVNLPDWTLGTNQTLTLLACILGISTTSPTQMQFISADDNVGSRRRWQWRTTIGPNQEFLPWAGSSSGTVRQAPTPYSAAASNMVALVIDPALSDAAGKFKFYINGTLSHSGTQNGWAAAGLSKPAIGSRSNQLQAEGFIGTMGPCALFTTALTAIDISAIWAARNTP